MNLTNLATQYTAIGNRRGVILAAAVVATAVICLVSYLVLVTFLLRTEEQRSEQRAQFFATAMDAVLTRLEHLPYVLSINPKTLDALAGKNVDQMNAIFDDTAQRSRAEFVYLLDTEGQTIASSNYRDADTLVGKNYRFRPYFRDAITGNPGRFYAVGVTTGRPGYFIAEPVRGADGTIFGVVVVKIAFADLSRTLSDSGELVMVTNLQNVVLASSRAPLLYGHIEPLSDVERQTLAEQRQFGDQTLFQLDWITAGDGLARLDGTDYVWTQAALTQEDWTLHLMSRVGVIRQQALLYVAFGLMTVLTLAVAAAIYRTVQLRTALAISNADRRRLAKEIDERRAAEEKLETARSELARQNQLAALGQLSASITHELGQPISAMRNYLVAEEIATDTGPGGILPELSGLVDRMQRLLSQLRQFGRTPPAETEVFSVPETVEAASKLVQHTAVAAQVSLDINVPPDPCSLSGQPDRFEQVIVNLLRNAIDAVTVEPDPKVTLDLSQDEHSVILKVTDNGTGLGNLAISDLREPFFSTKASGQGMGLGLAISGQIVNEMGGVIRAENGRESGAIFTVIIPKGDTDNG